MLAAYITAKYDLLTLIANKKELISFKSGCVKRVANYLKGDRFIVLQKHIGMYGLNNFASL